MCAGLNVFLLYPYIEIFRQQSGHVGEVVMNRINGLIRETLEKIAGEGASRSAFLSTRKKAICADPGFSTFQI